MIISKRAIPRRTMLRGMGAMLALPLLDSMVPALSALQTNGREAGQPVRRVLRAERDDHEELPADGRRRELRADARR